MNQQIDRRGKVDTIQKGYLRQGTLVDAFVRDVNVQ